MQIAAITGVVDSVKIGHRSILERLGHGREGNLSFQAVNSTAFSVVFGRLSNPFQTSPGKIGGMSQIGHLIGLPAMRNWRQVRGIRFDHEPINALQSGSISNRLAFLKLMIPVKLP